MLSLKLTYGDVANPHDKRSLLKTHPYRFRIAIHTDSPSTIGRITYSSPQDLIQHAEELAQTLSIQDMRVHINGPFTVPNYNRAIISFHLKNQKDYLRLKAIIAPAAIETDPETRLSFKTKEEADFWFHKFIGIAQKYELGTQVYITRDNPSGRSNEIYFHTHLTRHKALLLMPYLEHTQTSEIVKSVALLPAPKADQPTKINGCYLLTIKPPPSP